MQYSDKTRNGQTKDTGSIETIHTMDKPETHANTAGVFGLSIKCLWFIHQVSSPNIACVSGLSIVCIVSILPVSLVCPLRVLSEYCMCLWLVHYISYPNTACVSGLSIMCFVSILPVSLVCPFPVLTQYCMRLWFVHYVSCLKVACEHTMDKPETHAILGEDT
jgi:hypothetical protein